jgi:hypothetical protein
MTVNNAYTSYDIPTTPYGGGLYQTSIPLLDPAAGQYVRDKFAAAQKELTKACEAVGLLGQRSAISPQGTQLFCSAIGGLAWVGSQGVADPVQVQTACEQLLKIADYICKAASSGDFISEILDRFNSTQSIRPYAILSNGTIGYGQETGVATDQGVTIDFPNVCLQVDHIEVTPNSAKIAPGKTVPLSVVGKSRSGGVIDRQEVRNWQSHRPRDEISEERVCRYHSYRRHDRVLSDSRDSARRDRNVYVYPGTCMPL